MSNHHVRCASCHKTLAVTESDSALRAKVYCDDWCRTETPSTQFEARNDVWKAMVAFGVSPVAVARKYEVAHSQVYKAVAR
jgi:hypothetical protein